MSGKRSRDKGARGEREACAELERLTGVPWHRSLVQTRHGGTEAPDVVPEIRGTALDRLHVEVKRGKAPALWSALEQAKRDSGDRGVPLVLARRDRGSWVVLVELDSLDVLVEVLNG